MWIYNGKEFTEDNIGSYYGFVYLIENTLTNKKYVGKKFFYTSKTKQVKGKKKKFKIYSDWQTYYGSNEELKKDVEHLGKNFLKEQLFICVNQKVFVVI